MAAQAEYIEEDAAGRRPAPRTCCRAREASIVPADSISGRALLAVIAIMTFLAALTLGAVVLVRSVAGEWQSAVAREITIQLRPSEQPRHRGRSSRKAVALAQATPGIAGVRPYSREESARLLEPWLGSGLALGELPVPRLIVVRVGPGEPPDFAALRRQLAEIPGATLDDHRGYRRPHARDGAQRRGGRAWACSRWCSLAAMMSVMFATRGAMSTNRQIIEVLHVVGAKEGFIASEFQRHFLLLGLKGGAIGGGDRDGAVRARRRHVGLVQGQRGREPGRGAVRQPVARARKDTARWSASIVLVAAVTAGTSRLTVQRTLKAME